MSLELVGVGVCGGDFDYETAVTFMSPAPHALQRVSTFVQSVSSAISTSLALYAFQRISCPSLKTVIQPPRAALT